MKKKDLSLNIQLFGISIILIELLFPYGIFLIIGIMLNIVGLLMAMRH